MKLKQLISRLTGFSKHSPYVKDYLGKANLRSGVFMALIIMCIEIWMVIRYTHDKVIPAGGTPQAFFKYNSNFILLFLLSTAFFVFCLVSIIKIDVKKKAIIDIVFGALPFGYAFAAFGLSYRSGDTAFNSTLFNALLISIYAIAGIFGLMLMVYGFVTLKGKGEGKVAYFALVIVITAFAIGCLAFGFYVSYYDRSQGKEIMCFLTMVIYVGCLLVWRPFMSVSLIGAIFIGFFIILEGLPPESRLKEGDKVNYLTFMISLMMVAISIYTQRLDDAMKTEEIERRANTDDLTGLLSYSALLTLSGEDMKIAALEKEHRGFLFINVNNFKVYNDQRGFSRGNDFLRDVGKIIQEIFLGCLCCRQADDHFIVYGKIENPEEKLEKIRDEVRILDAEIAIDVTCGAYFLTDEAVDPRRAIDRARFACLQANKTAQTNYGAYDRKMADAFRLMQYVIRNIDKACDEGWVRPYYQPVVWAKDKKLCSCEALARWVDPKHGFLSPAQFVPVLESAHLIHKLDEAILRHVCQDIRRELDSGKGAIPVSINFSRLDFELMDAVAVLNRYVEEYKIPKDYIHIEITESALTDNTGKLSAAIQKIKEDGYALWLDDFGSGYSSLNVLKDYDFDVLKIDMKFLAGLTKNKKAEIILEQVLDMADALGMKTLSEGVEHAEDADFLSKAGCGRLQGYLYGKPMPLEDIEKKIASKELVLEK